MKGIKFILVAAAVATSAASVFAGLPITNAYDDADNGSYGSLPNHNWSVINGGFCSGLWAPDTTAGGGGTYLGGPGVDSRGGSNTAAGVSFPLYRGGGGGPLALSPAP